MAKYRIRIDSLSEYDMNPWYYLEQKTWYGGWKYVNSSSKLEYLEKLIKVRQQEPEYYS